ncbi:hypothetical protein FAM09_18005 [Niastella caeni]|uniref:Cytochrome C Planctomycete-type domain-containing protein n=1 Tax=Niastella caeni TaxID=2569763 RepID=A0A4S8HQR7_9BACT|nr:hypothetical protein [Niastella caeni]THU36859.1 hypothetical protein FAM09_18005 [Niastella caeni]
MKKMLSLSACVLLLVVLVNACKKDSENDTPPVDCSTITTTFSGTVRPLMASSCAKPDCHASGSTNGPGALTNYTQIFNARAQIRTVVASGQMPQDATFSANQKAIITCWIDAGAPNN